jgi:HEAT repeat protein
VYREGPDGLEWFVRFFAAIGLRVEGRGGRVPRGLRRRGYLCRRLSGSFAALALVAALTGTAAAGQEKPDQVAKWLSRLQDKNPEARRGAVMGLGISGDRRAVEPLIAVLERDPDARVRRSAAFALGQLKDPRAVEPLIAALRDGNPEVCINSIFSLIEVGKGERYHALVQELGNPNPHVCRAAAVGLVLLNSPREVPALIEALEDSRLAVRTGAAFALGFLDDARAVEPLVAMLEDSRPIAREAAIGALALLGDKRAVPKLAQLAAHDPNSVVRQRASVALRELTYP